MFIENKRNFRERLKKISTQSLEIETLWGKLDKVAKVAFLSSIIVGFLCHLYFFVHKFINEDDVMCFNKTLFQSNSVGRWFLGYIISLRGSYGLPLVIGVLAIIFCAISAVLTVKLLKPKTSTTAFIIGSTMASFPTLSYGFGYLFMADAYMYSLFFAVLSVFSTKRSKYGFLMGSVFLALSLGIYQSYIGYAIGLILIILMNSIIDGKKNIKEIGVEVLKYLIMGVLGVILYFVVLKLNLYFTSTELMSYKGADKIGDFDLYNLPSRIARSYKNFIIAFLGGYYPVSETLRSLYIIEFAIFVISVIGLIFKNKLHNKPLKIVFLILGITVLPLGLNIVDLMAAGTQSSILNIYQFVLVIAWIAILVEKIEFKFGNLIRCISFICLISIVFNFVLLNNRYYMKADLYFKRTFSLTSRILARIEGLPEFGESNKIAIVGKLPNVNYQDSTEMIPTGRDQGFWGQYVGYNSSNSTSNTFKFTANVNTYHGIKFDGVNQEEMKMIQEKYANDMPIWPKKGSVDFKDGIIIVNLNHVYKIKSENLIGNTYRFDFMNSNRSDYSYAWYIYKDNKRIDTIWYKTESYIKYNFEETGEYKVQAFRKGASDKDRAYTWSEIIYVDDKSLE